jgi:hypothetical protein
MTLFQVTNKKKDINLFLESNTILMEIANV